MRKRVWPPSPRAVSAAYKKTGLHPTRRMYTGHKNDTRLACPLSAVVCAAGLTEQVFSSFAAGPISVPLITCWLRAIGYDVETGSVAEFIWGIDNGPGDENSTDYAAGCAVARKLFG